MNKYTNKKDERITFAEEFIASDKTIEAFAMEKKLNPKDVEKKLDEMKNAQFIKDKLTKALEKNSNRFLQANLSNKEKLLAGKIDVKDVKNIDAALSLCNPDERKIIMDKMTREMASHNISIMEYKSIFGIEGFGEIVPSKIMQRITEMNNYAKRSGDKSLARLAGELYKENSRINAYIAPFDPKDLKRIGYIKPGEKEPTMLTITDEHIAMAKQYLIEKGEFICSKTMSETFMKIAKGELNTEKTLPETESNKEEKNTQEKSDTANRENVGKPIDKRTREEIINAILEKQKRIKELDKQETQLKSQTKEASK